MPIANAEVARLFRQFADLLEIQGANPFRVRAYRNAARVVGDLPEPVATLAAEGPERLDALPGIGADLAGKIVEIVSTGNLGVFRELARTLPKGLIAVMHLPGLGPKRTRALFEELGIRSLAQLEQAARAKRVRTLRGFGAKTEARILREVALRREAGGRVLRSVAAGYGGAILEMLAAVQGVEKALIAGSFRRLRDTVGDLDILVTCENCASVVDRFVTFPEVEEVLAQGPTRASVRLRSGLQVDLRVLPEESYGAGLYYFTGSKAHTVAVRTLAQERGLKMNEYGVYRGKRRIAGKTEEGVLATVGLPWIPPELREDRGEIEAARRGTLPKLVGMDDIRGDLQCHTPDSDGRDTLAAMARAAEDLGYEYLAITDHSPALAMIGGLDRAGVRRQMRNIDRLNGRLRRLTVLKGAEVEILEDGSLDLDDDTLAALDVVVASIHTKLDLPAPTQTARLTRAVSHSSVDIIGHPSGRLLGHRRGARFDLERVCRAAADHGVLLEINAQPDRLDLDDTSIRTAIEHGVTLVIDTDAHATTELRYMRWGVDQARRGWAEKRHIGNTRPLARLLKLLHRARH